MYKKEPLDEVDVQIINETKQIKSQRNTSFWGIKLNSIDLIINNEVIEDKIGLEYQILFSINFFIFYKKERL